MGENLTIYAHDAEGTYVRYARKTDAEGVANFNLPAGEYIFRYSYNGKQFYSSPVASGGNVVLDIPAPTTVALRIGGENMGENLTIYAHDAEGTYVRYARKTDAAGVASFNLPAGDYTFRHRYDGVNFYSSSAVSGASVDFDIPVSTVIRVFFGSEPLSSVLRVYPFTADDVYVGYSKKTDENGQVFFNLHDGEYKFRVTYAGQHYFSSPVESGRAVEITIPDPADENDGEFLLWTYNAGSAVYSEPKESSDGSLYFGSNNGRLVAVDSAGVEKWFFQTGGPVYSSPAVADDGSIVFGSFDRHLYVLNADGSLRWKFATPHFVRTSPVIDKNGNIYFGSMGGVFYALNSEGGLLWSFQADSLISASPALDSDENLYFGTKAGVLYALNRNGEELWRFVSGGAIFASPVVSNNRVVFGSYDHKLYALDKQGVLLFAFETEAPIRTSPVIDTDGTILFGSENNKLYALRTAGQKLWAAVTDGAPAFSTPVKSGQRFFTGSENGLFYAIDKDGQVQGRYSLGSARVLTTGKDRQRKKVALSTADGLVAAFRVQNFPAESASQPDLPQDGSDETAGRPEAPVISEYRAGSRNIYLSWAAGHGASQDYRVYLTENSWDPAGAEVFLTSDREVLLNDLNPLAEYCVAVSAINNRGESDFSNPFCLYPLDFGNPPVRNDYGVPVSLTDIQLSYLTLSENEFASVMADHFHPLLSEFVLNNQSESESCVLSFSVIDFGSEVSVNNFVLSASPSQSLSGFIEIEAGEGISPEGALWFRAWDGDYAFMNNIEFSEPELKRTTVSIELTAPEEPGFYFLVFAADGNNAPEYLFSATTPDAGEPVWADGNDLSELGAHYWIYARKKGFTPIFRLENDGHYLPTVIGAAVLGVRVE
jgi:outer membrane protein assembly factor BamB